MSHLDRLVSARQAVRRRLPIILALLPLVVAACNKGSGGSGY